MSQKIVYNKHYNTPARASPGDVYSAINSIINVTVEEEKKEEATEHDIIEFLEEPDNILIVYGQKITGHSRTEVLELCRNPANIYKDEEGKKYVQIAGRHLIKYEDLAYINDPEFSIFNVSTLLNVILVINSSTAARQKRSFYELKYYSKIDFHGIMNDEI